MTNRDSIVTANIAWSEERQVHIISSNSLDHAVAFEAQFYSADLKRSLERAANEFLLLVEKGNPEQLARYSARRGIVLGHVAQPALSPARIQDDIQKRQGIFCSFFESGCLPKNSSGEGVETGTSGSAQQSYSYRERLVRASTKMVDVRVSYGNVGTVAITLLYAVAPYRRVLEFEFTLEDGEWKFAGIPLYMLHFPPSVAAPQ
jgi:hypothetical protein